ncbi:YidB family protein [Ideonella sp. B508-1]|uniref:YidB family protein n=1 Tax=Ideonella sp. B508-1 TaxID=137716 RepID=UPI000349E5D0|nr:YidB family protein [Ideonella sp. B508-1]
MGLLDAVSGLLNESTGGGNAPDLMSIASQLLDSNAPGGGLAGLVQHFEQGGLGEVVGSWISNGQNLPISADQLQSALGSHPALAGLLQQAQGPQDQALLGQLAQMLPELVNKMTPQGQLPATAAESPDLGSLLGGLSGLLKG